MALHLLKLCVGVDSVAQLRRWQARRLRAGATFEHRTRSMPRRRDEILAGGSLYWVVKGFLCVRQRIVALESRPGEDGRRCCAIRLDPALIATLPRRHRPFQGWRYLDPTEAPADVDEAAAAATTPGMSEAPPAAMLAELRSLGLL